MDLVQKTFFEDLGLHEEEGVYYSEPESCAGKILFSLFTLCKRRSQDVHRSPYLSDEAFIEEHRTIAFRGGRQMGHSTAIAEMSRLFKNPLIVVPNAGMAKIAVYVKLKTATMESIRRSSEAGRKHDAVFVDCFFYLPTSMEEAFSIVGGDKILRLVEPEGWVFLVG